jgi:hypothetical protein
MQLKISLWCSVKNFNLNVVDSYLIDQGKNSLDIAHGKELRTKTLEASFLTI